jgi:hypothetical protein
MLNRFAAEKPPSESDLGREARPDSEPATCDWTLRSLADAPRDVGWLLLSAGIIGEIVPGVIGTPFWVVGTLMLWPPMGERAEAWLESQTPNLYRGGMRQVRRFLDDLDRRYPLSGNLE